MATKSGVPGPGAYKLKTTVGMMARTVYMCSHCTCMFALNCSSLLQRGNFVVQLAEDCWYDL